MTATTRAIVKEANGPDAMSIRDVATPRPGFGQVLLAPRAVGVCGSDLHTWRGTASWELSTPVVLGHEVAGEIIELGDGVDGWVVGDRVVCETNAAVCDRCRQCRTGHPENCVALKVTGAHADGFFTGRAVVDARWLHRIPESLGFEQAALLEPLAVAYAGVVRRGAVQLGEDVVVVGAGAIGILAAQVAKAAGARSVTVIGTDRDRRRAGDIFALGLGDLVDVTVTDTAEILRSLDGGRGADLVIDAAGASAALVTCLEIVAMGGRVVKIGWGPQPFASSLDMIVEKTVSVIGSRGHSWSDWERCIGLVADGVVDVERCIGGRYELDDWRAAFEDMESGRNIKSVMVIGE